LGLTTFLLITPLTAGIEISKADKYYGTLNYYVMNEMQILLIRYFEYISDAPAGRVKVCTKQSSSPITDEIIY